MKRFLTSLVFVSLLLSQAVQAENPLRVFIRSGAKTHGPGAHDYPAFLKDWTQLLNERGAKASGGNEFPTREQLAETDVLVLHAEEAGNVKIGEERKNLLEFLKRGGGVVVIHGGAVSRDPEWYKSIIGGSWKFGTTKWLEGHMSLYFTDRDNPITKDCSNFDLDDEIYYDMEMLPEVNILAAAYTPNMKNLRDDKAKARAEASTEGGKRVSIYDIQPQMWTYEKENHRAFVCIPGHNYANFSHNTLRTILLRGIAWAGKRANADELCKEDELSVALRYPEGGPTRPEKAAEKIEVHPDFDLSLVAAEPLINKAMNIDWDAKGRMWVAETPEYPNGLREPKPELTVADAWKDSGSIKPGRYDREPQDRISILVDEDGDGRMDRKQVFADKLELVTSFVFHGNGVIACAAPDIWYLQDTDGDDVADKRTKLYTGLGTADTHAVMNNMRWGQDGWIYATHGYSAGDVTPLSANAKDGGKAVRIGSGVVRFKPDGSEIEMYSSKNGNTWGLTMTWDGQCFWTQPTSGTVFFHTVLPESILAKGKVPGTNSFKGMITGQKTYPLMNWEQQAYVQIDQVGAYTAASGCAIYEGDAWPERWNYSYFTTEPTLNIVSHYFVKPDGVSYEVEKEKGREETEFMRSKDLWFRPIETRVGPDGALYVIDFYNQAVIHNDTRGPLHGPANAAIRPDRDHYFGRIWKMQHREAKKIDVPVLKADDLDALFAAVQGPNAHTRKNAFRLISEQGKAHMIASAVPATGSKAQHIYEQHQNAANDEDRQAVLNLYIQAEDDWTRSALIAAASDESLDYIKASLKHEKAEALQTFVTVLLPEALKLDGTDHAISLIISASEAPSSSASLKAAILQVLTQRQDIKPVLSDSVAAAFRALLADQKTADKVLPLVIKWDDKGLLKNEVKTLISSLESLLQDNQANIQERINAATALISAGSQDFRTPALAILEKKETNTELQSAIITALGLHDGAEQLVAVFASLKPELRTQAFDVILKKPQACLALLKAVEEEKLNTALIGTGNTARLRTHPNRDVSVKANALLDKLNPSIKAKNELIAKLTPEVTKPGDAANGKVVFTAACAMCHKFGDVGVRDVGPPLTGMGAHGAAELLVHVIDPNREVDPSFWQWNITTKKGESYAGVITSENAATVTLRNQGGDVELKKEDIATRENTHHSLMPEGLEGLGPDMLRDLFAFMMAADSKFRVIDLRTAYTADARRGLFASEAATKDSVFPSRYGNVMVDGIPFFIMDSTKSQNGTNLIVLKGGGANSTANAFPQKVEISTDIEAKRLHFLSGIAGWGWPAIQDDRLALKVTLTHADGQTEVVEWKNGIEFADYIRPVEVKGSKLVEGVVKQGQLRLLSLEVKKPGPITKITLESGDNHVSPVVVAITADREGQSGFLPNAEDLKLQSNTDVEPKSGGKGDSQLPEVKPVQWEDGKKRVLIVSGGSSHNFGKYFGATDVETLKAAGFSVNYTEDRDQAAKELASADVAVISVNRQFFDTPAWRKALFDFAAAGKGIIMMHPGTWYAYPRWPELNKQIVGGGSRGHDKLGPFQIHVVKADHPVMKGVPKTFDVVDELYYVNAEPLPEGTASIEVLAETSPSQKYGKPHPSVWTTQHPTARIVNIALGHDERVHDMEAFKVLLGNAVIFVFN